MEFKKIIIILSITITILLTISLAGSYAWYAYDNAKTATKASSINEIPTVIFKETDHILVSQHMPIHDEDRYNYGNKFSFTITFGKNLEKYETALAISLTDIAMSEELKIENYKYELLQDGKTVSSGNFANIGNNSSLEITPMNIYAPIKYPMTYTFDLFIWLSEDETNQNNLMNKAFMAKLKVNSANKKKINYREDDEL